MLTEAAPDITAFAAFPQSHWRRVWSTNPLERANGEIKRRADVAGILPDASPPRTGASIVGDGKDSPNPPRPSSVLAGFGRVLVVGLAVDGPVRLRFDAGRVVQHVVGGVQRRVGRVLDQLRL